MEKIFSEILGMSVDSALLIIAVIIVRALLQKAPMYFRKVLWGLVGLRLLIPFSFKSAFSLVPQSTSETVGMVSEQVLEPTVEQGLSFLYVAPFLWVAIGLGLLTYGAISYVKLKLRIVDGILEEDNIYYSDKIDSPFVCGFIKPRIYLPFGLDEATQNCVLQHEKTHIKNADHLIKAISFVVLCVHWFNPLVWVSYFLLFKDIELSCDESVIKNFDADSCKQYAKALLELGVNKIKFTACPVAFGEVGIKKRIKSVVQYKKASRVLVGVALCLCVAVAVCFMTEPQVKAQEIEAKKPFDELTTEEVTTVPTTETQTTPQTTISQITIPQTTEVITESVIQKTTERATTPVVTQNQRPVEQTKEMYDDSMFDNEDDGLARGQLNKVNVASNFETPKSQTETAVYDDVTYIYLE